WRPGRRSAGSGQGETVGSVGVNSPESRWASPDDAADLGRLEAGDPLGPGVDGRAAAAGVEEGGERPLLHKGVGAENLDHLTVGEDHVVDDVTGGAREVGAALHRRHRTTAGLWIVRGNKLWTT